MVFNKELSFIIATRLRTLREGLNNGKGLSHQKLSEILSRTYGIEISKDSLLNYEVMDRNHAKAYKNLGMKVEYLYCLADFYGVSMDYLLGRTNDSKVRRAAVDDLGLSPDVVEWLRSFKLSSEPDEYGYVYRNGLLRIANTLFENQHYQELIENLCNMFDAAEAEQIYYATPIGTGRRQQIQQIIDSRRYGDSVTDYLRAQCLLSGSTAPKEINDAFMFGINVTEVVAGDINRSLNGLLEDIRKMAGEKTEKED